MDKYKHIKIGFMAAFLFLVFYKTFGFFLSKSTAETNTETPLTLLEINYIPEQGVKDVPSLSITSHGEKEETFTLESLKGKPTIIHIWATWCGPCIKELPAYNRMIKEKRLDVHHVALTPDATTFEKIIEFCKQHMLDNMPIMTDDKGAIARHFDVKGFPTTLFLNKEGKLLGRVTGAIDWTDPRVITLLQKVLN